MRSKPLRTAVTYWPKTLWNAVRSWCGLVLHPPLLPNPRRSITNVFGCGSAALCSFAAILFADSPISITHLKLRLVTRFPLDTATDARPLVRVDRFVEENCIDSHAEIPAR